MDTNFALSPDALSILTQMGDYLDSIDDVREINDAGFNRIDKANWPATRGNMTKMLLLLKKYKRQLSEAFPNDIEVLALPIPDPELTLALSGQMLLASVDSFPRGKFEEYRAIQAAFSFRWMPTLRAGAAPIAGFPLEKYLEKMSEIGFVFGGDIAVLKEAAAKAPERAVSPQESITIVRQEDGKFCISFPFSRELNQIFSNRSGILSGIVEYNPQTHARETYSIDLVTEAMETIKRLLPGWTFITKGVAEALAEHQANQDALKCAIPSVAKHLAPGFSLFPYQNEMVLFLEKTNGNAIVGDEMGLGKTLQSLSWVVSREIESVLVVCPKVVRRTWIQEAIKFFPNYFTAENTIELTPKLLKSKKWDSSKKVRLATVNYESVDKFSDFILNQDFQVLIVDESHRIKNPKTATFRSVCRLAQSCPHRMLLSGTAIKNKKSELFTQVELVSPGLFGSPQELLMSTIGSAWNRLQGCYLARQKMKVLKDLPEKLHSVVALEVPKIEDIPKPESFDEIAGIKAQIAIAKVGATVEFLSQILSDSDSSVLVFSDSVEAATKIAESFGDKALLHHGQMSDNDREQVKAEFQEGKTGKRIFVSTRQSLAVGATLTIADKVVFSDLPWTIADVSQAEDRVHRIGQKRTVNVYWVVADNHPWDRYVAKILAKKQDLCKKMNQGQQLTQAERDFINKAVGIKD